MKQRTERMGVEIQAALGEILARGDIKDPRVRNAGLVTITRVQVTGDLREARVAFTVHGADEARLGQTRNGLSSARAYLQQALGRRLRTRNTPALKFEIDRALDQAFYVDGLLREVEAARIAEAAAAGAASGPDGGADGAAEENVDGGDADDDSADGGGESHAGADGEHADGGGDGHAGADGEHADDRKDGAAGGGVHLK